MADTDYERRDRRRREKMLVYSPGEWLWVIGFFGSWSALVIYLWPELWPVVAALNLTLALIELA